MDKKLDKDVATEVQRLITTDPDLMDECAGWHVIAGKSFAASITYHIKWVLFFDLLENTNKSFLLFKTDGIEK